MRFRRASRSVAGSLSFVVGIALALLALVGGSSLVAFAFAQASFQKLYDHPFRVRPAAFAAAYHAERVLLALYAASLRRDDADLHELIDESQSEYEAFLSSLEIVERNIYGQEGKDLSARLRSIERRWEPIRTRIFAAALRRDAGAAVALLRGENEDFMREFRPVLESIIVYAEARAAQFKAEVDAAEVGAYAVMALALAGAALLLLGVTVSTRRWILGSIGALSESMIRVEETGELVEADSGGEGEIARLASLFNGLLARIRRDIETKDARSALLAELSGKSDLGELASSLAASAARRTGAEDGAVYLLDAGRGELVLAGGWGRARARSPLALGEGAVGQAALDGTPRIVRPEKAEETVATGLADFPVAEILLLPLRFGEERMGVAEYRSLRPFPPEAVESLAELHASVAPYLRALAQRQRIQYLLGEAESARRAAEESSARESAKAAALSDANTRLEEQQQELEQQGEELRAMNQELLESARALREKQGEVEERNRSLGQALAKLEEKGKELETASRYKSEFLSRMSHELRTPLNSLLILARELSENRNGGMAPDQVEAAGIILNAGRDLLALINEILDLARIESGKLRLEPVDLRLADLAERLRTTFAPIARERGLEFVLELEPSCPASLRTDGGSLERALKNLLANALKFTESGSVRATVAAAGDFLAFRVTDSGIGIPEGLREAIFQPFEQADSSISRRFGGSGLGLAISRELARLLGGRLVLERSEEGKGSTFLLELPLAGPPAASPAEAPQAQVPRPAAAPPAAAPRADASPPEPEPGEGAIALVVEDDPAFAAVLARKARERGLRPVVCSGGAQAVAAARRHAPRAILLDLGLPDMDGREVLDRLKADPSTRSIPVHVISASDEPRSILMRGSVGYFVKPVSEEQIEAAFDRIESFAREGPRSVLVVEDDPDQREALTRLLGSEAVTVASVATGSAALEAVAGRRFDCLVVDLGLPDLPGFELLERLRPRLREAATPVIVYSGRELGPEEANRLREFSESIIVKGAASPERLVEELAALLGRGAAPAARGYDPLSILAGKRVLLVDDDVRNLFALARVLDGAGMRVAKADSGERALAVLDEDPGIDLVLTDVMMPGIDGIELIRRLRADRRFARLPVIAVTAKAMKADRDACMAAGASDYLTKPVDVDRLLSLLRVWLYP